MREKRIQKMNRSCEYVCPVCGFYVAKNDVGSWPFDLIRVKANQMLINSYFTVRVS